MGFPEAVCCECGAMVLGTCGRCGRSICSQHRIVCEEVPTNPGASGVFCPACYKLRTIELEKPSPIQLIIPPPAEAVVFDWVGMLLKRLFLRK